MMKQEKLRDLHPFHIQGLQILRYDPRNSSTLSFWGQKLQVSFSNPVGDIRYQNMDVIVTFQPESTGLLGTLWTSDTHVRRTTTCNNSDLSFFKSAVELYQGEVANQITLLVDRILRRVLISYISTSTKVEYDARLKDDKVLVSVLMENRSTDERARFVVGYHFEDEVFYARYVLEDSISKGERQDFDSNDPLREVLVDMSQSLLVEMRARGWAV